MLTLLVGLQKWLVSATFIQIYLNEILDLLPRKKELAGVALELREHPDLGIFIKVCGAHDVSSVQHGGSASRIWSLIRSIQLESSMSYYRSALILLAELLADSRLASMCSVGTSSGKRDQLP